METVINCKTAIKGHTKKTKLAGVTRVGNNAANSAFVVAPTVLVNTFDNVASQPPLIGPMLIMDAMLMRPKYDNDMRAGTWLAILMSLLRRYLSALPRFLVTLFPNFVTGHFESSGEVVAV